MSNEVSAALDAARQLAMAGIPVFVAAPDPSKPTGFALPNGWQHSQPFPRVVDFWRPGMALAMVCGHGLDLLDVDPRGGGDINSLNGGVPVSYALAVTPSGGVHSFIRSLGVRSRDKVLPGVDVKAGDAAGEGRGFAFIAPTVRVSKTTGQLTAYRWVYPPDLARWAANAATDTSGTTLATLVQQARAGNTQPSVDNFMKAGPWSDISRTLSEGRGRARRRWYRSRLRPAHHPQDPSDRVTTDRRRDVAVTVRG